MKIKSKNGIFFIRSDGRRKHDHHCHYSAMMQRWLCDCEDFAFRRMKSGDDCKHITACREFMESASMEQLKEALKWQ